MNTRRSTRLPRCYCRSALLVQGLIRASAFVKSSGYVRTAPFHVKHERHSKEARLPPGPRPSRRSCSASNRPRSRSRSPPGALPRRLDSVSAYYRSGAGMIGRRASWKNLTPVGCERGRES